jgi:hypothetical protein
VYVCVSLNIFAAANAATTTVILLKYVAIWSYISFYFAISYY